MNTHVHVCQYTHICTCVEVKDNFEYFSSNTTQKKKKKKIESITDLALTKQARLADQ